MGTEGGGGGAHTHSNTNWMVSASHTFVPTVRTQQHLPDRSRASRRSYCTFDGVEVRAREVSHNPLLLMGGAHVDLQGEQRGERERRCESGGGEAFRGRHQSPLERESVCA